MQIVSNGDNLHEMSIFILWKNKREIIYLSFGEIARRVLPQYIPHGYFHGNFSQRAAEMNISTWKYFQMGHYYINKNMKLSTEQLCQKR